MAILRQMKTLTAFCCLNKTDLSKLYLKVFPITIVLTSTLKTTFLLFL